MASALIGGLVFANRNLVTHLDWRDYLGQGERTSLEQSLGQAPPAGTAPRELSPDGLFVMPVKTQRRGDIEATLYEASCDDRLLMTEPLTLIEAHWREQGFAVSSNDGVIRARGDDGALYAACATDAPADLMSREPQAFLWRITKATDEAADETGMTEAEYADLLPPVSDKIKATRVGRPGAPGYSLSITVRAMPRAAFEALSTELEERGWSPLTSGSDLASRAFRASAPGSESAVFRHEKAPLGCQLLVSDDPAARVSHVLLSLF